MKVRVEKDHLGEVNLPEEVYYGINTFRSHENFDISKKPICRQMIKALALVKKSAAYANYDAGLLTKDVLEAISLSCDEIQNGRLQGSFITDLVQGGGGFGMNMNANEVIANRANEMMGGEKGIYDHVNPIYHVNLSQSTNDVISTAGKIAATRLTKKLIVEMKKLVNAYLDKAEEFKDKYTLARTHLLESARVSYKELFTSTAHNIQSNIDRIESAMKDLLSINLGGTIVGNSLNVNPIYKDKVCKYVAKFSGEKFVQAKDLIDSTCHIDSYVWLSSALKLYSLSLNKIANDLRLSAMLVGNVSLPTVEASSTNYPGRSTPVIPEMVNQVAYYIEGNDLTICRCGESGELELNNSLPIVLACLFESLNFLRRATRSLRSKVIEGLTVNDQDLTVYQENNVFIAYLRNMIGYEKAYDIVMQSKGARLYDYVVTRGILSKETADDIIAKIKG